MSLSLHQLKRVRESERQCKPLLDKNKLLSKRNDDLTHTIQKLEEKLKSLARENLEMVSTKSHEHMRFLLFWREGLGYRQAVVVIFRTLLSLCVACLQKEKISSHPPLKKLKSLNDLDQAHDDQEIAFLKLQVLEQQSIIDELTRVCCCCCFSLCCLFVWSFLCFYSVIVFKLI